jgi:hypothetical protein
MNPVLPSCVGRPYVSQSCAKNDDSSGGDVLAIGPDVQCSCLMVYITYVDLYIALATSPSNLNLSIFLSRTPDQISIFILNDL